MKHSDIIKKLIVEASKHDATVECLSVLVERLALELSVEELEAACDTSLSIVLREKTHD